MQNQYQNDEIFGQLPVQFLHPWVKIGMGFDKCHHSHATKYVDNIANYQGKIISDQIVIVKLIVIL
jgi:hypothetical protein